MSETNDNNFDELKRLLKLKRHEIPPPGYFNHFSGDVVTRIRAGETGGSQGVMEQFGQGSWLANLIQLFQAKPGLIGGLATSLCLMLLVGVVMADHDGSSALTGDMAGTSPDVVGDTALAATTGPLMPAGGDSGITISTNPVTSLQPVVTLFGSQQNPLFQQAGFMAAGQ